MHWINNFVLYTTLFFSRLCLVFFLLSYHGVNSCPLPCICLNTRVDCSHKNLTNVPQGISASTTELDLSFNLIDNLMNFTFSRLNQLSYLNLCFNRISYIDSCALDGLAMLQVLNLTVNKLDHLNSGIFKYTPRLERLYLKNNGLTEIPALSNLTELRILDLSANLLIQAYFPPSFQLLTNLVTVRLSENNLGQLSANDFKYLPAEQIRTFDCRACNLTQLKGADTFSRFKSLYMSDFGKNHFNLEQLSVLIESLSAAINLKELKLTQLIDGFNLPSEFFKYFVNVKLKTLSLSYSTNYGILQDGTFLYLKHLTTLLLKHAEIVSINPRAFEGLDNLEHLYLDYVGLSFQNYPQFGILFPPSLLTLSLSGNCMRQIIKPHTFDNLPRLRTLYLRKCDIYGLDNRAFSLNNSLQTLDLSHNLIYEYDKFDSSSFQRLSKLTELLLTDNDLNEIISKDRGNDILKYLVNLKTLQLSRNKIEILPVNFFNSQSHLISLDLKDNSIKSWDSKLFYPLKRIAHLSLAHNKIQVITNESIQNWKNLKEINLEGNPFNCGCDLLWFLQWIRQTSIEISFLNDTYFCGSPEAYRNTKLLDVNVQTLQRICSPLPIIIYISAASVATLIIILLTVVIIYRFQWYLKWYCYRCCHGNNFADEDEDMQLGTTKFFIFLSYHKSDESWADEIVSKLEKQFGFDGQEIRQVQNSDQGVYEPMTSQCLPDNGDDREQQAYRNLSLPENNNLLEENFAQTNTVATTIETGQTTINHFDENFCVQNEPIFNEDDNNEDEDSRTLIKSTRKKRSEYSRSIWFRKMADQMSDNQLVYYEKRCLPNQSTFQESAKAIYSCKFVLITLSTAYLRDRRLQFELDLIQTAMTERYGYDAFNHIIFVTAEPTGELMHLIPEQLRRVVDNSCILWSATNEMQQNYFWEKFNEKLYN